MRWLMAAALLLGGSARGAATLQASGEISASARAMTGVAITSMTYDPRGKVFLCLPDQSGTGGQPAMKPCYAILQAGNGKTLHDFHFDVKAQVTLRDALGHEMTGAAPETSIAGTPSLKTGQTCIKPEAIAIGPDAAIYISDGYGPSIYQFERDGKMIRRIEFDSVMNLVGTVVNEQNPVRSEPTGLCVFPDHQTIGVIFQGDQGMPANAAFVTLDLDSGLPKGLYDYPLSSPAPTPAPGSSCVTDMAALDQSHILVVENAKDGKPSGQAVWLVDVASGGNRLTQDGSQVRPQDKSLLFDAQAVATGSSSPASGFGWAGIAIIPPTYDEVITVLIVANSPHPPTSPLPAQASLAKNAPPATEFFKIQIPLPSSLPSN